MLLRHEAAYTLGQMQRLDAVPFLEGLLMDPTEDPVTRHEAAEALGAIEAPESLSVLERCGCALPVLAGEVAQAESERLCWL